MAVPEKITFRFSRDEDYRVIPVNGVWGGATPRGDVRVELFHESETLPETVTHAVAPGGQLGEELDRTPTGEFERKTFVGMMLTAKQAESIGLWLQAKAREARERAGANGKDDESERDTTTN